MLIDADFCGAHPCPLGVHFCILQFWGTFWIGLDQPLFTFLEALRRDPAHLSDCLPMHPNSLQPHNITIYTNTQIQTQIQKHKYTNTNTQTQIHKYKYTNTRRDLVSAQQAPTLLALEDRTILPALQTIFYNIFLYRGRSSPCKAKLILI